MEIKRISEYTGIRMTKEEFEQNTTVYPIKHKAEILSYLRRFDDWAFTSQPVYDIYTGEKVADSDNAKTDGIYTWYVGEIYFFGKYNLALNRDFIEHILNILPE